jgi:alpha-beta hydrolase superfamily lysophospholipase
MRKLSIPGEAASFDVTMFEVERPSRVVLFAVGGGGNPERHGPLLAALAERGCSVVAPHFERLVSPIPTEDDLRLRACRLKRALDAVARPGVPTVGVGHSIGAAVLLALAGGQVWMGPGRRLLITRDDRIERLALMAPATGFFQAPGALDAVRVPILAWAGTKDAITPPAQAELLRDVLAPRVSVDLRVVEGAGHFSFMNAPPPQTIEPLPDRDAFLAHLAAELDEFVAR